MKICLDPGHGGSDPGAVNGKRYEKDDVLRLALAIKPLLEAQGIETVLTRDTDKAISIADRCALANKTNCAYFLSLHRDAAQATAYGVSAWIHSLANVMTTNKAQTLLDHVLAVAPTYNRRVNKGSANPAWANYGVNVQTNMASCLLELGFMTNSADNDRFDLYFNEYAVAITRGLCKIVGVEYKEPVPDVVTPITEPRIYRVQVGAFSVKANAEKLAAELKTKGYQAFVKGE